MLHIVLDTGPLPLHRDPIPHTYKTIILSSACLVGKVYAQGGRKPTSQGPFDFWYSCVMFARFARFSS